VREELTIIHSSSTYSGTPICEGSISTTVALSAAHLLQEGNMADNCAARRTRNPAKQTQDDVLDFSTKKDIEFCNKACDKLEGDPYDGTNLSTFLKMFGVKAKQYNWMRILTFGQ
jgi:hypothetical protein